MSFIIEPAKKVPIIYEADVCVIGGSATGVFAAVRAARLGARVVIVEKQNSFGGVATNGLVAVWHTFNDKTGKNQIISGLTEEVVNRIDPIDSQPGDCNTHFFNPHEMKIELDAMLKEQNVKIYLHTYYAGLITDGNRIDCVLVENKDGRGAIKARFFVDATGDGDLCRDLGVEHYVNDNIQPPSAVMLVQGKAPAMGQSGLLHEHHKEFDMDDDWGWTTDLPGLLNMEMRADTHIFNVMCNKADDLTKAEIEGREKMRKIIRMLRKYGDPEQVYSIVAACSYIGIRDTYHYKTKYQANYLELLLGKNYDDNILNGTYNIDVHHKERGIMFMQFDGTYTQESTDGTIYHGNWRKENGIDPNLPVPTCYHLPFKCLVGEKYENIIAAGRMINADQPSFGALRVMVNLNQIGEAAGVAAFVACDQNKSVQDINGVDVAKLLSKGGSANLG
ncbi:MAG: FAD-dependent oxidoreductase [Clostridiales bacterium]|nr:FAD-dependent oxidoreductase [Clostridiales bacterium]